MLVNSYPNSDPNIRLGRVHCAHGACRRSLTRAPGTLSPCAGRPCPLADHNTKDRVGTCKEPSLPRPSYDTKFRSQPQGGQTMSQHQNHVATPLLPNPVTKSLQPTRLRHDSALSRHQPGPVVTQRLRSRHQTTKPCHDTKKCVTTSNGLTHVATQNLMLQPRAKEILSCAPRPCRGSALAPSPAQLPDSARVRACHAPLCRPYRDTTYCVATWSWKWAVAISPPPLTIGRRAGHYTEIPSRYL